MTVPIPSDIPAELTAGMTWQWTKTVTEYPAADGWSLTYRLVGTEQAIAVAGVDNAGTWDFTKAAADTASLAGGVYTYAAYAEKAAERFEVQHGSVTVRANPQSLSPGFQRSHAERMLDLIDDVLEGRIEAGALESYTIGGRQVTQIPLKDLHALRSRYAAQVAAQRGGGFGRRVVGQFTCP